MKHKKAGTDAKRAAIFSKLSRLITAAAAEGGSDPEANFKLRQAVDQAREAGMPKGNIERATERASSSGRDGISFHAVEYEAYGPGGSAFLISGLTDNSNRTTGEIKRIIDDFGGRLAGAGSVAWMFDRRVIMEFAPPNQKSDEMELELIDAGAEDVLRREDRIQAVIRPEKCDAFQRAINDRGLLPVSASVIAARPRNAIALDQKDLTAAEAMISALEDHPDINDVWTNIAGKPR
ncbi:MAG: YebC/PmpR family DNA-binding transcriptional regulator [Candidatus Sungbacteria bacterium]|nr:YebC/PmpR family DNA-binding transcriptional regulator [Candidatus Sungbacteria bacterium]